MLASRTGAARYHHTPPRIDTIPMARNRPSPTRTGHRTCDRWTTTNQAAATTEARNRTPVRVSGVGGRHSATVLLIRSSVATDTTYPHTRNPNGLSRVRGIVASPTTRVRVAVGRRASRSCAQAIANRTGARKKLPCVFAHRTAIGNAHRTPFGCRSLRESNHCVSANQRIPNSWGRTRKPPASRIPAARVSPADDRREAPTLRHDA